jgi:serine/threonine protein kinase
MTSAPSDDDDRTRLVEPDDERTRIAAPIEGRTAAPARPVGAGATLMMTTTATRIGSSPGQPAFLGHNAFEVGTKIGEFEILDLVGEGGFGIVYLAHDHSLDRKVALKEYMPAQLAAREGGTVVMKSDKHAETFAAGLRSFINEARLLAQFDHHSLVKVYRFWEANGTAYMVMPFYEGITLKRALKDFESPPDETYLKALLAHLLDALEIIHNRQCYHRDIAPDNILILPDETPLLLDFGAARRVIGDMTQALTVILKPGYAPIEQYAEVPDMKQGPWTDLYALASVIYFAITGKAPVPSVARVMSDSLVPLAQCAAGRYSDSFLRAIDSALAVRPEQRPQNIAEFRRSLGFPEREPATRFMPSNGERGTGTPAIAPGPSSAAQVLAQKSARSSGARKAAIGGLIAAALAGVGYVYFTRAPSADAPKAAVETPVARAPAAAAATAGAGLLEQVREKLAGFECARLDASLDAGAAVLSGHVAHESDLTKVRGDVGNVKGIGRVNAADVQIVPPSYCPVVSALGPFVQPQSGLPAVALKGGAKTAREGDKLIVEVTGASFPGFVYADLYDQEGNVVHLLPNAKEKKHELQAGQRVMVGDDGMFGMQWDVVPPLGKHLLVVTVSASRLFDRQRPDMEAAAKYTGSLQEALKKQSQATANYHFVDFSPRR